MSPTETGQPPLPERISGLAAVATNLSWSWSRDARALFREVDEALWHLTRHNPIELLRRVDPARLAACAQDPAFLKRYDALVEWNGFVAATHDTWFETSYPDLAPRVIAYFCAEFGLHASVPIYSGGLGVLAGDHCKSASACFTPRGTPINGFVSTGGRKMRRNASISPRRHWSGCGGRTAIPASPRCACSVVP